METSFMLTSPACIADTSKRSAAESSETYFSYGRELSHIFTVSAPTAQISPILCRTYDVSFEDMTILSKLPAPPKADTGIYSVPQKASSSDGLRKKHSVFHLQRFFPAVVMFRDIRRSLFYGVKRLALFQLYAQAEVRALNELVIPHGDHAVLGNVDFARVRGNAAVYRGVFALPAAADIYRVELRESPRP